MEVHLVAKLGIDGQIQSIQSSCEQSTGCPIFPQRSRDEITCNFGPESGPERFVPYVEKKILATKLGAKVDEMSILIHQLADLGEKNKLQQKLIQQYEQEISAQRKRIHDLEKDLFKWKSKAIFAEGKHPLSMSLDRPITTPKQASVVLCRGECCEVSLRRRSWPGGIDFRSFNDYEAMEPRYRFYSHDHSRNDDVTCAINSQRFDGDFFKRGVLTNTCSRKSSIRVGVGLSNTQSHFNLDFESVFFDAPRDEIDGNGYSVAQNCPDQKLTIDKDKNVNLPKCERPKQCDVKVLETGSEKIKTGSENAVTGSGHCSKFPVDRFGYLEMDFHLKDKLQPAEFVQDVCSKETCVPAPKCSTEEVVHVTHRELYQGHYPEPTFPSADDTTPSVTESYFLRENSIDDTPEVCLESPHYETIHWSEDGDVTVRPPLPPRRGSRSSISSATSSESQERPDVPPTPNCHTQHSAGYLEPRPSSLPLYVKQRDSDAKSRRIRRMNNSKSTPTLPRHGEPCRPESQPYNLAESRRDDTLNMLYKDMRTTMEWNITKRKLMEESHDHTVDLVERQLRAIVKEVYEMFGQLKEESRSRQRTKEKVFQNMRAKLEKENYGSIFRNNEFLLKCIEMVIVTTPT